jgi:hypothetical protein
VRRPRLKWAASGGTSAVVKEIRKANSPRLRRRYGSHIRSGPGDEVGGETGCPPEDNDQAPCECAYQDKYAWECQCFYASYPNDKNGCRDPAICEDPKKMAAFDIVAPPFIPSEMGDGIFFWSSTVRMSALMAFMMRCGAACE